MSLWSPFEHEIHKILKDWDLRGQSLSVGLSGGADSVALLWVLKQLAPVYGFHLSAHHIHHGPSENFDQNAYRDQALVFCQQLCEKWNVDLAVSRHVGKTLHSEEQMREFRRQAWKERAQDYLVLAHHQEDLLETRLLRLIRGTGQQGLPAMQSRQQNILRPFLSVSRESILEYLKNNQIAWLEDPSNMDAQYLRNWLRHEWLPQLEKQLPGGIRSLARSLEQVLESSNNEWPEGLWLDHKRALSHPHFMALSVTQQRSALASYLLSLGHRNFTRAQIDEVIKHLDKKQTRHTFKLAQLDWDVDAQQICVKDVKI